MALMDDGTINAIKGGSQSQFFRSTSEVAIYFILAKALGVNLMADQDYSSTTWQRAKARAVMNIATLAAFTAFNYVYFGRVE